MILGQVQRSKLDNSEQMVSRTISYCITIIPQYSYHKINEETINNHQFLDCELTQPKN